MEASEMTEFVRSVQDSTSGDVRTWVLTGPGGATTFSVLYPGTEGECPLAIATHARQDPNPPSSTKAETVTAAAMEAGPCDVLADGSCFGDMTYRAGSDLHEHWAATGRREETIYNELKVWYERRLA